MAEREFEEHQGARAYDIRSFRYDPSNGDIVKFKPGMVGTDDSLEDVAGLVRRKNFKTRSGMTNVTVEYPQQVSVRREPTRLVDAFDDELEPVTLSPEELAEFEQKLLQARQKDSNSRRRR